jgi:hypothetical protein
MGPGLGEPVRWQCHFYQCSQGLDCAALQRLASAMPKPHFEAYTARSLHRQGAFAPDARGWWLPQVVSAGRTNMTVKLSARALQEVLAGRTKVDLAVGPIGGQNPFAVALRNGRVIKSVSFEEGGIDQDDDYIIFTLEPDPAASKLSEEG